MTNKTEKHQGDTTLTIQEDTIEEAIKNRSITRLDMENASIIKNGKGIVIKNRCGREGFSR